MPRARSPDRDKAEEIYLQSKGNIKLIDIADQLGIPEGTIRGWKNKDSWEDKLNGTFQKSKGKNTERSKKKNPKRGAPKGNKNAAGHGAPEGNKNAEKHGLFSKYLPEETLELVELLQQEDEISRLKRNIAIQEAAIIRAQSIMHVESKEELIKHLKKVQSGKVIGQEWEFQYAWDRQGNFLSSLSRAMATLISMYRALEELTNEDENDVKDTINNFVSALNSTAEDVWGDEEEETEE